MSSRFRARIGLQQRNSQFFPLSAKLPKFPQTQTLIFRMVTQSKSTRRPTCPSCSKPTPICLCNRLRTPALHNSVTVTILQHSLEKKHPLNSTRIATVGLKNVDVATVSDVNFHARFFVCLLDSSKLDEDGHLFDEMPSKGENDELVGRPILGNSESGAGEMDLDGQIVERIDFNGVERRKICKNVTTSSGKSGFLMDEDLNEVAFSGSEATVLSFTIEKYGAIRSFNSCWMASDECREMSFDQLLASERTIADIRKGFAVKKLGTKLLERSNEYEESEEFEIAVPPGSVLLFPSERSVDVEDVNFQVKNLIVLDGTWAKAKRMYNENPWLRLLPHIKLDIDKLSLYSEVRHQPRAGYMSTIESIVHTMKAVGEDSEGLDGLLDVFESMVGDQRRCKNERLSKASQKRPSD